MGAGNVKAAFGLWGTKVDHAPRCLLAYMANTAKDDDDPPLFWGGRESLALALGRVPPHSEADFTAVKRAIGKLVAVEAIELVEAANPTRHAKYRLNLRMQVAERPAIGGRSATGMVVDQRAESGSFSDGAVVIERPPKEKKDGQGPTPGQTTRPSRTPHRGARSGKRCRHDQLIADDGYGCVECDGERERAAS